MITTYVIQKRELYITRNSKLLTEGIELAGGETRRDYKGMSKQQRLAVYTKQAEQRVEMKEKKEREAREKKEWEDYTEQVKSKLDLEDSKDKYQRSLNDVKYAMELKIQADEYKKVSKGREEMFKPALSESYYENWGVSGR